MNSPNLSPLSDKECFVDGCTNRSTRGGEHVITMATLRWMDSQWGGPYTAVKDGETHLDRDDEPWSQETPIRYKLPCCEKHNQILSTRFESNWPEVEAFLNAEPYDAVKVGIWWLKTILLFVHPQVIDRSPREPWSFDALSITDDLYSWLVDGSPPPDTLSLFCMRPSQDETIRLDEGTGISLGSWTYRGVQVRPAVRSIGIADINFVLTYAPGYSLPIPSGAHRLWPITDQSSHVLFENKGSVTPIEEAAFKHAFNEGHAGSRQIPDDEPDPRTSRTLPINATKWRR